MKQALNIAIVGAGPAGMYSIGHLLEQRDFSITIDLFDRLPTPWGLVRAGVAPDHPEKKWVAERLFDFLLDKPNVNFMGNVEIGRDITVQELSERYDGVIYSVGANSDNKLGVEGENLTGSLAAREFVAWYNGHPDYRNLEVDLSHPRAVVVGNGNVALDVARMLTLPIDHLQKTDIAPHALEALKRSQVNEVVLLGRRGYSQGAFNNPELEELLTLDDIDVVVEGDNFADQGDLDWISKRKVETLKSLAERKTTNASKKIVLKFLASPLQIEGDDHVEKLTICRNKLVDKNGKKQAVATDETETLETGLVLRAIGYRGSAFPGLPFDEKRGTIANQAGRVIGEQGVMTGSYVTGWIKRGPKGVIGSNKKCAHETVNQLLEDARNGLLSKESNHNSGVETLLKERQLTVVTEQGWRSIDRAEKISGKNEGRPRVKFSAINDMLDCIQQA